MAGLRDIYETKARTERSEFCFDRELHEESDNYVNEKEYKFNDYAVYKKSKNFRDFQLERGRIQI